MIKNNQKPITAEILDRRKISKVTQYGLQEDVIRLRQEGYTLQGIADELNNSGKVPEDDRINKHVVLRYLNSIPITKQQMFYIDKDQFLKTESFSFDIIGEVAELFVKTKNMMAYMEDDCNEKNIPMNPSHFKALVSEMRGLLDQLGGLQKEVHDYNNVRKFMEIILTILEEEAPEKIPAIADRLKMTQGTQWFAGLMNKETQG